MTGLVQRLATAPEGAMDKADLFLQHISDLPIIQEMLPPGDGRSDGISCTSEECAMIVLGEKQLY